MTSLNNASVLSSIGTPLFGGDGGLILQVYLLVPTQTSNPSVFNYTIVPTTGLSLEAFLTNGVFGSGIQIYTQQVNFSTDINNQYFYASFPLNTANGWNGGGSIGVLGLLDDKEGATATLQIGFLQNGLTTSEIYLPVNLIPGIPTATTSVPAGLTALSLQAADNRYVQLAQPAGQGRTMTSPLGVTLMERCVDNGDGTARIEWSPVSP